MASSTGMPSPPSDLFALDFLSFNSDLGITSPQIGFQPSSESADPTSAYASNAFAHSQSAGGHLLSSHSEAGPSSYLASQPHASSMNGGYGPTTHTPAQAGGHMSSAANTPSAFPQQMGTPVLAGTPNFPSNASHASTSSRRGSMDEPKRGGSLRGRPRAKGKTPGGTGGGAGPRNSLGSSGVREGPIAESAMDLDQTFGSMSSASAPQQQSMPHNLEGMAGGVDGFGSPAFGVNGTYASAQAMLQQLENFHVQSPAILDPSNAQSPYNALSNLFMAQSQALQGQGTPLAFEQQDREQAARQWNASVNGLGGFITPGPSGDMFPQLRPEMMSPMQLELLAKANGLDPMDPNLIPLLSPALTQVNGNSVYASPLTVNLPQDPNGQGYNQRLSPLEALQEQQRQFQEQLVVLQQRQQQLAATAAVVVAAQASPYLPSSASSGQSSTLQSRTVMTPGIGQHGGGGGTYFSPLTSPALVATRSMHAQSASPAIGPSRPPHPLSALSSPALNPVGSAGGANQTLSPALEPQFNGDLAEPDLLRGFRNADRSAQGTPYQSPNGSTSGQGSLLGTGGSTGPHRQALPQKTRPSPMIRPTHRSRQSTVTMPPNILPGQYSLPASPSILRHPALAGSGLGSLPPSVIDQRGVQQALLAGQQAAAASTASTPSPVDLAQIMPPPPVPVNVARSVVPMTPASLMNLGGGGQLESTSNGLHQHTAPNMDGMAMQAENGSSTARARRQSAVKAAAVPVGGANQPAPGQAAETKRGKAAGAGKRNSKATNAVSKRLAMKPSSVGVRAAVKGAAAAAMLPLPEGETRKTSHKAAEQKRRDSLKAGFDELRLLLPAINTEALDPETGEPIPGSSAPRLLPKSSLVPDDNPNRGVSKVALLKFSNEYIVRLQGRLDKRDGYIDLLKQEIERLRLKSGGLDGAEITGEAGEDLLAIDMAEGEEEEFGSEAADDNDDDGGGDDDDDNAEGYEQEAMMDEDVDGRGGFELGGEEDEEMLNESFAGSRRRNNSVKVSSARHVTNSRRSSSSATVTASRR